MLCHIGKDKKDTEQSAQLKLQQEKIDLLKKLLNLLIKPKKKK